MISRKFLAMLCLVVLSCTAVCRAFVPPPPEALIPPDGGLDREAFVHVLEEVSGCLDEDRLEDLSDLITYDFLYSITNAEFQPLARPYTLKWAADYGDQFPESYLLQCLAGGDVAVFADQYDSLTNLVSRNCIRWCLMLNDIPLNEPPVMARNGKYFKMDQAHWIAYPGTVMDGRHFSKGISIRKRGLIAPLHQVLGEGLVVEREDGVPVPWGNSMDPDFDRYPYITDGPWVDRRSVSCCSDNTDRTPNRRGYLYFHSLGVSLHTNVFRASTPNRVWNFFAKEQSPLVFAGGQAVATPSDTQLKGKCRFLCRVLVAKNGFRKHPMEHADQDLLISPPIHFDYVQNDTATNVIFTWEGEIEHVKSMSFEEALEEARKGEVSSGSKRYRKIIFRRWIIKAATGIILLAGLIQLLKTKDVTGLSADAKRHRKVAMTGAWLAAAPLVGIVLFYLGALNSFDRLGSSLVIMAGILVCIAPLTGLILGIRGCNQKMHSRKLPMLAIILNTGWLARALVWLGWFLKVVASS